MTQLKKSKIMEEILDISYDKTQFDKIKNLTWYPWVGKDYKNGKRRILVIGDSHYAVNSEGLFDQDCFNNFMTKKEETRNVVKTHLKCLSNGETTWNFFRNLENTFPERNNFWSKIAFYNFIQEPMKQSNAKPKTEHYKTAWPCFVELIKILKPTDCIFIGVRSETCFGYSCQEMGIDSLLEDMPIKIDRTRPRKGNIVLPNNYALDLYFIHHTAQYYSPAEWGKFLSEQLPEAMNWLNSKE